MLIDEGYPVVRNQGRKQKGMSPSTLRTPDAADPKRMDAVRKEDASLVVSMDGQTGRMAAGARQAVKLESVYNGIIIIL